MHNIQYIVMFSAIHVLEYILEYSKGWALWGVNLVFYLFVWHSTVFLWFHSSTTFDDKFMNNTSGGISGRWSLKAVKLRKKNISVCLGIEQKLCKMNLSKPYIIMCTRWHRRRLEKINKSHTNCTETPTEHKSFDDTIPFNQQTPVWAITPHRHSLILQ